MGTIKMYYVIIRILVSMTNVGDEELVNPYLDTHSLSFSLQRLFSVYPLQKTSKYAQSKIP